MRMSPVASTNLTSLEDILLGIEANLHLLTKVKEVACFINLSNLIYVTLKCKDSVLKLKVAEIKIF